jgi:hypothetical protein
MTEDSPSTSADVIDDNPLAITLDVVEREDNGATAMETSSFSKQLREWFIRLSPEERAAAMGFVDIAMVAVLAKSVASSEATAISGLEVPNNNNGVNEGLNAMMEGRGGVTDRRSQKIIGKYSFYISFTWLVLFV